MFNPKATDVGTTSAVELSRPGTSSGSSYSAPASASAASSFSTYDHSTLTNHSIVDERLTMRGDLESDGAVFIKGKVIGNIRCKLLIIDAEALVEGGIECDELVVRGRTKGTIEAVKVRLEKSASVDSEICRQSFSAEEGAKTDIPQPHASHYHQPVSQVMPSEPPATHSITVRPSERTERARALSSLTSGLAPELAARRSPALSETTPRPAPQPQASFNPPPTQPAHQPTATPHTPGAAQVREGWSLGDLLARASVDEEHGQHGTQQQPVHAQPPSLPAASQGPPFNVAQLARALDAATAAAIWSKLRGGQRGVMARSIYSTEGRATFDDVSRRFASDPNFQVTVGRYLAEFERIFRETEKNDPTGLQAQPYANSECGRVYLFLAHASGRLS